MEQFIRPPEFYTFSQLAIICGVPQKRIENDLRSGRINNFLIETLNIDSSEATKRRITILTPILNKYALNHLHEGPYSILAIKDKEEVVIDERQKKELTDNIHSDSIFRLWLNEFKIDIDQIRIVLPYEDAVKYEKYLKMLPEVVKDFTDAEKYISDALSEGMEPYEIAIQVVEKLGSEHDRFYGTIGRKLAGYDESLFVNNSTWRQRGYRFYQRAKSRQ